MSLVLSWHKAVYLESLCHSSKKSSKIHKVEQKYRFLNKGQPTHHLSKKEKKRRKNEGIFHLFLFWTFKTSPFCSPVILFWAINGCTTGPQNNVRPDKIHYFSSVEGKSCHWKYGLSSKYPAEWRSDAWSFVPSFPVPSLDFWLT